MNTQRRSLLTVVVAAYNEADALPALHPRVAAAFDALRTDGIDGRVLYVDDGAAIILDADGQDPPELIPQFVAKWREGFDDVHGTRTAREGVAEPPTAVVDYLRSCLSPTQPQPADDTP